MAVLKKGDGTVIATRIEFADNLLKQMAGLMFRKVIPDSYAMIFDMYFEQRISIHMLFVPFPIDLAFLDRDHKIVDTRCRMKPWIGMAFSRKPARYAVEMPAGTIDRFGLKEGESLDW